MRGHFQAGERIGAKGIRSQLRHHDIRIIRRYQRKSNLVESLHEKRVIRVLEALEVLGGAHVHAEDPEVPPHRIADRLHLGGTEEPHEQRGRPRPERSDRRVHQRVPRGGTAIGVTDTVTSLKLLKGTATVNCRPSFWSLKPSVMSMRSNLSEFCRYRIVYVLLTLGAALSAVAVGKEESL